MGRLAVRFWLELAGSWSGGGDVLGGISTIFNNLGGIRGGGGRQGGQIGPALEGAIFERMSTKVNNSGELGRQAGPGLCHFSTMFFILTCGRMRVATRTVYAGQALEIWPPLPHISGAPYPVQNKKR